MEASFSFDRIITKTRLASVTMLTATVDTSQHFNTRLKEQHISILTLNEEIQLAVYKSLQCSHLTVSNTAAAKTITRVFIVLVCAPWHFRLPEVD